MLRCALVAILLMISGCGPYRHAVEYNPLTDKDVMRAWAAAYNRDQIHQLALLVHPQKRADFNSRRRHMEIRLEKWLIRGYTPGASVRVNEELAGRNVVFQMVDGTGLVELRNAVVVETRGRWWVWRF